MHVWLILRFSTFVVLYQPEACDKDAHSQLVLHLFSTIFNIWLQNCQKYNFKLFMTLYPSRFHSFKTWWNTLLKLNNFINWLFYWKVNISFEFQFFMEHKKRCSNWQKSQMKPLPKKTYFFHQKLHYLSLIPIFYFWSFLNFIV